mgnify:CR=1 FL=1
MEGDGKAFKDLDEDEYVCPKLHRGGASSGRDKRCRTPLLNSGPWGAAVGSITDQ